MESLHPDQLHASCPLDAGGIRPTFEVEPLPGLAGQDRAEQAIALALGVSHGEYNLFVLGPPGAGKHALVRQLVDDHARGLPVPHDWCYVYAFDDPRRPRALRLPPGRAIRFRDDVQEVVTDLEGAIPAAFDGDDYQTRADALASEVRERQEAAVTELGEQAQAQAVALMRTPVGLVFAPVVNGEVLPPESYKQLSEDERDEIRAKIGALEAKLEELMNSFKVWEREARHRKRKLDAEVATTTVSQAMQELKASYADIDSIREWLEDLEVDVVDHLEAFLPVSAEEQAVMSHLVTGQPQQATTPKIRYAVNVIVDHADAVGGPVVYEDHPIHENIVGRLEYRAELGAMVTDFSMLAPGALHRANGGVLILDARKVLTHPYAWEALKRALFGRELRIEPLGRSAGLMSTATLEPEPIPLDVKVVLVGERRLYYLLSSLDSDFARLFRIAADFEDDMPRTADSCGQFSRMLRAVVDRTDIRHLDTSGVARMVEHAARRAGDRERLSLELRHLEEVLVESNVMAKARGAEQITAADVEKALAARFERGSRLRERGLEAIVDGTKRVDTRGQAIGQINGLTVMGLGSVRWGAPARITAQVRLGKGDVVDIERAVELGGAIHSKGVLILSGFLGGRFARDRPLALSASLVFEQSYGGVDGDSASMAELCALLSAIARIPLRQDLAMTGSVDQYGRAQAIGGVNEKIEGFFDTCVHQGGLSGTQGVLVPASNVRHLMLARRVVSAVEEGRFFVYPFDDVDQAIALLSGASAESVYAAVDAELTQMSEALRQLSGAASLGKAGER